ncbi:adenosylmethionine-8-amino-7-oxononanoate transaminase [Staphylococcus sp. HGB0015]|uniref:Adenosylmethionine-8-amino-7-oxononanoate aminotransferase n=2 Tax=Staphylococcus schleiferi TaxID=1295 RepID=A0A7Z7QMJ1_STASC|nr:MULTISPECIES: adenosylmethionine--8-amino-7-oxononanoate transaminase [Staphylococcus]EPD49259.1 adenosylmethionine-8-amino-7-oxononanoate transaminase [Staphylococcus sp. HGB0015]UXR55161.1 adenosylmethionine--8-amino-7-oxononanoate transaminase [Staphylococcus schleiferi]UXR57469.1 adenosylmethionine--8-amino-7-oxononanoate transaminase [Staphylococcus schleiferi]UXR59754.1 adenosylmethionine--8-amino-7-oxononanoate transaminase [Staphylococcus schleiferi]UXR62068.1 adenosylmethionine--8-
MMKHKALVQKDLEYVWHPFTQMGVYAEKEPIIIESGKGSYLYDTKGRRYLDGYASLWVNVHGHQNQQLNRAIQKQLKSIAHSTLLGSSNIPSIKLAEKLVQITPERLKKVFYSDTGSAAVEIAIKIAYQYWKNKDPEKYAKKNKFLTLHQAYHGDTIGSVSVGGIDTFHRIFNDLIFENIQVPCPSFYHSDAESEAAMTARILDQIEKLLQTRGDEIVGFVIEPLIQGATGLFVHPKGFLKAVEQLCRKYDVLLIVDEVAVGFGRTGKMFACEHEDVQPDLMCLGKAITGGYVPLAATLTSQEIYDAFLSHTHAEKTFFHGHTYTGNQVVCAVALENIKLFKKRHLISQIQKTSQTLAQQLHTLSTHPYVGDIRGRGLMYGVELVANKEQKTPLAIESVEAIIDQCKQEGLMIRNLENVITFVPVLSMSNKEIKKMVRIFKKVLLNQYRVESEGGASR